MKSVSALLVAAVVVLALFTGTTPVPAQPAPKAVPYEYKFFPLTHGGLPQDEEQLNKLAGEGWEVVVGTASPRVMGVSPSYDTRFVLKRPKR
jgi:hypothetical protein